MRELTSRPFGVNIAQAFVREPEIIVDFVIDQGVKFVTTSAGSPTRYTKQLKDGGRGEHGRPAGAVALDPRALDRRQLHLFFTTQRESASK